jgi:hypothetical protein
MTIYCAFTPTAADARRISNELLAAAQREADSLARDEERIDALWSAADQWGALAEQLEAAAA